MLHRIIPLVPLALFLHFLASAAQNKLVRGKVGTGFSFNQVDDFAALSNLSWWYDWGTSPSAPALSFAATHGIEYVPMQWANWGIEELIQSPTLEKAAALLGFNEPNHRGQANLEAHQAAALWPFLEEAADKYGLRLGSPSAAPCGIDCIDPDPFAWWDKFFEACQTCRVDFMAVHIYSCNSDAVRWFLNDCAKYKLPVWVTEFACPIGPGPHEISQEIFMASAVDYMEAESAVERFAWFAPRVGGGWVGESASLLKPREPVLSDLGALYMQRRAPSPAREVRSARGSPERVSLANTAAGRSNQSWRTQCQECFKGSWKAQCRGRPPASGAPDSICSLCQLTCGFRLET